MAKIVYNLNRSTLTAKKVVVYTLFYGTGINVKPVNKKFYSRLVEAKAAAKFMNMNPSATQKARVAKTILVRP